MKIHKAGWEPITNAITDSPCVLIERFGNGEKIYFTVYNNNWLGRKVVISVDRELFGMKRPLQIKEMVSGTKADFKINDKSIQIKTYIEGYDLKVYQIT